MSKNVIAGQITQIGDLEIFGENGFQKKEIIIKTIAEIPQFYVIEFIASNVVMLQDLQVGDVKKITANLNGREYTNPDTGKYSVFMSLRGWKIEAV